MTAQVAVRPDVDPHVLLVPLASAFVEVARTEPHD